MGGGTSRSMVVQPLGLNIRGASNIYRIFHHLLPWVLTYLPESLDVLDRPGALGRG